MLDDLIDRISSYVRQEYEILIPVVPHEDIGLAQGFLYMVAEFIDNIIEFRVSSSVLGRKREQDLTGIDVVSQYISDNIAVNRGE